MIKRASTSPAALKRGSFCIRPKATIATSGLLIIGVATVPPITPILEMVIVPPFMLAGGKRTCRASSVVWVTSSANSLKVLFCTCLILGTSKPLVLATAIPILISLR